MIQYRSYIEYAKILPLRINSVLNIRVIFHNPGLIMVASGKRLHNYGKSSLLMGKLMISMAISNSYVKLPEGNARFDEHRNAHEICSPPGHEAVDLRMVEWPYNHE